MRWTARRILTVVTIESGVQSAEANGRFPPDLGDTDIQVPSWQAAVHPRTPVGLPAIVRPADRQIIDAAPFATCGVRQIKILQRLECPNRRERKDAGESAAKEATR
ncbi:hypothetical protein DFH06DRAFT_1136045 [Mycena polygramma]|nr:hypothetical protein DFH06DRAFT_1136045 [Mycena polygramma]